MSCASSSLPVSSTTAHLQPVRWPGSMPSTVLPPNGAASSSSRRFCANTSTASRSERILSSTRTSTLSRGDEQALVASALPSRSSLPQGERRSRLTCALDEASATGSASSSSVDAQHALVLAAADREEAMRGDGRDRLLEARVRVELRRPCPRAPCACSTRIVAGLDERVAHAACGPRRARRCARRQMSRAPASAAATSGTSFSAVDEGAPPRPLGSPLARLRQMRSASGSSPRSLARSSRACGASA